MGTPKLIDKWKLKPVTDNVSCLYINWAKESSVFPLLLFPLKQENKGVQTAVLQRHYFMITTEQHL